MPKPALVGAVVPAAMPEPALVGAVVPAAMPKPALVGAVVPAAMPKPARRVSPLSQKCQSGTKYKGALARRLSLTFLNSRAAFPYHPLQNMESAKDCRPTTVPPRNRLVGAVAPTAMPKPALVGAVVPAAMPKPARRVSPLSQKCQSGTKYKGALARRLSLTFLNSRAAFPYHPLQNMESAKDCRPTLPPPHPQPSPTRGEEKEGCC